MKLILSFLCLLTTWCSYSYGADILYVSLTPSPSHHIWDKTLAMALREKNHRITFVTHSVEKNLDNFTVIHFEGIYEKLSDAFNYDEFASMSNYQSIVEFFGFFDLVCDWDFETKGFQDLMKLINSKQHFDLIIFDMTSGQCMYPIIEKLNAPPIIATSQFGIAPWYTFHFGVDVQTPYIPIYLLPYTDKMTFYERLNNWFYTNFFLFYRQYVFMPNLWKKTQKVFGNNIKPYDEVEKSVGLLLANMDHVLDYPQSLPPAIIPVGGLHTKREKSLPEDIKRILDAAKNGVILFCLGTNFKSSLIKPDQRQALIEGLGRLKETVLWKFEEKIEGLPKNFIVRPWMPQNDILAHPNLKVFLTHGGGLSTVEAMFHGVPVVSMPFVADQILNTQKFVTRKVGQRLHYGKLTADDVYNTVSEVLNNPIYKENALAISLRYRDQPEDPLTRAVWWVEYSLRQKGAEHLRVAARDMPMYQLYFLDVWALIFVIIGLPTILLVKYLCCKKKKEEKKKKSE